MTRIRVSKRRCGVKEGVFGVGGGVRVVGVRVLHKGACYRWPRGGVIWWRLPLYPGIFDYQKKSKQEGTEYKSSFSVGLLHEQTEPSLLLHDHYINSRCVKINHSL